MIHELNLHPAPFKAIKEEKKTIEMRLNDEKKSLIQIGDFIVFTNRENNEQIKCEVTNIFHYKNFDELYKNHSKTLLGYEENEVANPDDMLIYYSRERIEKYGVLGIEIKLIKE